MPVFTGRIIPWDNINSGQPIAWKRIWAAPAEFASELFGVAMMAVGFYVVADLAYELGRIIGGL